MFLRDSRRPLERRPKAVETMRAALAAAAALCLTPWVAEAFSSSSMLSSSRCYQHASLREICDAVAILAKPRGPLAKPRLTRVCALQNRAVGGTCASALVHDLAPWVAVGKGGDICDAERIPPRGRRSGGDDFWTPCRKPCRLIRGVYEKEASKGTNGTPHCAQA